MRVVTFWLTASLLLAGCASPNPDFFTLAAVSGAQSPTAITSLEIRRFGLAGYLDRSEIVRATTPYRLHLSETERWGEPLGQMVTAVLTEDLVERLPSTLGIFGIGRHLHAAGRGAGGRSATLRRGMPAAR